MNARSLQHTIRQNHYSALTAMPLLSAGDSPHGSLKLMKATLRSYRNHSQGFRRPDAKKKTVVQEITTKSLIVLYRVATKHSSLAVSSSQRHDNTYSDSISIIEVPTHNENR